MPPSASPRRSLRARTRSCSRRSALMSRCTVTQHQPRSSSSNPFSVFVLGIGSDLVGGFLPLELRAVAPLQLARLVAEHPFEALVRVCDRPGRGPHHAHAVALAGDRLRPEAELALGAFAS